MTIGVTRIIYAIWDSVANDIQGGLYIHKHDASAIRFWNDICSAPDSFIKRHLKDYKLVQLGALDDKCNLVPNWRTVMTGEAWAATQPTEEEK